MFFSTAEDSMRIICIHAIMTFICGKQGIPFEKEQAESGNSSQTAKADCLSHHCH